MIQTYKIGIKWYDKEDKNGGLFEYNIIQKELNNIKANDTLVIVNGKFYDDNEQDNLLKYMQSFKRRIFIVTDIIALTDNINIIENCQYVLHQCPNNRLPISDTITQMYSWVPEIFYTYTRQEKCVKENKLIFGGGVRDNEHKIKEYLNAVPSVAYLKTDSTDNRLPYDKYLKELAKYKFALIIGRKKYNELGWVTPRYCEAIANDVFPICDSSYDISNHFGGLCVSSSEELQEIFQMYCAYPDRKDCILAIDHCILRAHQNYFRYLVIDIIGGRYGNNC